MKRLVLLTALFVVLLTGCRGSAPKRCDLSFFSMDTYMEISCVGKDSEAAAGEAKDYVLSLEKILSTTDEESTVYAINHGEAAYSLEVFELLKSSERIYGMTDGAFDVTVYPLMRLWDFGGKNHVPTDDELADILPLVDFSGVEFDETRVSLGEGQGIDFGGIAKGYACDGIRKIFEGYDIDYAICSLGGNIFCYKDKNGESFNIGIANPYGEDKYIGGLKVADTSVVTSGGYERYFEDNGVYHHILDTATGFPANTGIASVTIVSTDSTLADGLSTAVYCMGLEKATSFWHEYGQGSFSMIIATDDRQIYVTEDIAGSFTGNYKVNVIE